MAKTTDHDSMTMDELKVEATRLGVPGRSKMKVDELRKAVKKAHRADLEEKAAAAGERRKATAKRGRSNGEAVPVREGVLEVQPGAIVTVVRDVDLSSRQAGFAGLVPAGTTGTVTEVGRGGRQVTVKAKLGTFALGQRHLQLVEAGKERHLQSVG